MRMIVSLTLLLSATALFADTYLYRVPVATYSRMMTRGMGDPLGRRDGDRQPFYGTYVLNQPNTNYYLLKITKPDGGDPNLEGSFTIDLYQVQRLQQNGFILNVIDNSLLYPVNYDWSIRSSTGRG